MLSVPVQPRSAGEATEPGLRHFHSSTDRQDVLDSRGPVSLRSEVPCSYLRIGGPVFRWRHDQPLHEEVKGVAV